MTLKAKFIIKLIYIIQTNTGYRIKRDILREPNFYFYFGSYIYLQLYKPGNGSVLVASGDNVLEHVEVQNRIN